MRRVYKQAEGLDKTPGEQACRALLNENPGKFLEQLARLEEAYRERQERARAAEGGSVLQDAGTERAFKLIDQFLSESGVKE